MKPQAYRVGKHDLLPTDLDPIDVRGLFLMWEPPIAKATYVIGVDPVQGIAGWNRALRTKDDAKRDNAAIEVFRIGGDSPDVQVAEYAAPIDPYDLSELCNTIGHIYAGNDEDGQALMCIEVYPGEGWMVQRELISRYGYMRFPPWRHEDAILPKQTNRYGWYSTRSTRQSLWTRGISHLQRRMAKLNSSYLIEEMADCTPDSFLSMSGRARGGLHDDRVVSSLIALWYANEWSMSIEPTDRAIIDDPTIPDYQRTDISAARMVESWNDRFEQLLEE